MSSENIDKLSAKQLLELAYQKLIEENPKRKGKFIIFGKEEVLWNAVDNGNSLIITDTEGN